MRLSSLEIATGLLPGNMRTLPASYAGPRLSPREALERSCLDALLHAPCFVSFSGGLDSSLVLAVATRVARQEGLPDPIPATNRFPAIAHTDESEMQEVVVRHLGLGDWATVDLHEELEVVGPVAARALSRHGLLWPFNAHFHVPLLELARGGTLITGIGGDELFSPPRSARAVDVLAGRVRPRPRDALHVGFLAAPSPIRSAVLTRRFPAAFPWLLRSARRDLAKLWAADAAAEPARFGARVERLNSRRYLRVGLRSLDLLAADAGSRIAHPLTDMGLAVALAGRVGWSGFAGRGDALRALFPGLLPEALLRRGTKARFEGAFWGSQSRSLVASWAGEGTDPAVVDRDALRREWGKPQPDGHTYLMLQAAWLERGSRMGPNSYGSTFDQWHPVRMPPRLSV